MTDRKLCPNCGLPLPVSGAEFDRPILCAGCNTWSSPGTPAALDLPKFDDPPRHRADEDDRPRRRYEDEFDEDDEFEDDDDLPRPRRRRRSTGPHGTAVASLVLGIVSVVSICGCIYVAPLTSLIGVVLGFVSRKKPNSSTLAWTGFGLSLLALILSVLFLGAYFAFIFWKVGAGGGPGGGGRGGGPVW